MTVTGQLDLWSERGNGGAGTSDVWTVSDLVRACSNALEQTFGEVSVEGEVGSLGRPASGHLFFTLKDEGGQIQAVLFRGDRRKIPYDIEEGQTIRCKGRVAIYVQGGRFQLYVQWFEPVGLGRLLADLERLKAKLHKEGLFDDTRKKPLPRFPRVIGLVTSPTGAAIRDIIKVIKRRWPARVLISPTQVQGRDAPSEIVEALRLLDAQDDVDVIICGRGGGSMEDLWAFNDEQVVRAVAACRHPVLSAVGHERDWVLTDMAADVRAATPSAAAELAVPDLMEVQTHVETAKRRLTASARATVGNLRGKLASMERRLRQRVILRFEPRQRLADLTQRLQNLERQDIKQRRACLTRLEKRLAARNPRQRTATNRRSIEMIEPRLVQAISQTLTRRKQMLAYASGRLQSLGPLGVLERGYSLLLDADGKPVLRWNDVEPGAKIAARLKEGTLDCVVEACIPPDSRDQQETSS